MRSLWKKKVGRKQGVYLLSAAMGATLILVILRFNYGHQEPVDFNKEIRPIINTKCISCHGGVKESAGFSLFSREDALKNTESGKPAIIPGNPGDSELVRRLLSNDPEERMPYHAEPLSATEIEKLKDWIAQGAYWEDHWAYIKPEKPELPTDTSGWAENPVDHFIQAGLQKENLQPSPRADKAVLLRRLNLDLIGLPPGVQEVQDFVNDPSPDAYEKQVDRLLASPHFGERWAAMWLDLARYSDSKGYEKDDFRNIWRYRDYVIRSFNEDKPFNQFTIEQLAGDLLPNASEEQYIATAYHRNTSNNDEGGTDDEEFRVSALLDRVGNTWEVWQGTTMGCVQCHSHPYDPIRHEDFYTSMAFFNNTRDEDTPNESPTFIHFKPEQDAKIEEIKTWLSHNLPEQEADSRIRQTEHLLRFREPKIHPHSFDSLTNAALSDGKYLGGENNGFARLRNVNLGGIKHLILSISSGYDGGILQLRKGKPDGDVLGVYPVQKTNDSWDSQRDIIAIKPSSGTHDLFFTFSNPKLKDSHDYVGLLDWVLFTGALPDKGKPGFKEVQQSMLALLNIEAESTPVLLENRDNFRRKSFVFERGNWLTPAEEVHPGTPKAFPKFDTYPPNRLGFAKWLVNDENPLTARVTVNRFWEQLFGYGIVETLEDFGSQGIQPTHPELLDWMALNFVHEQQWSIKSLLKLMVMSNTYQQSSKATPELIEKDPANKWLARGPRSRLTAEQVRDQALWVGGLLSLDMYGKSVMPPQPDGVWQVVYSGMEWKTSEGNDAWRRAIYTFWRRSSPYPSLLTFDAAGREVCVSRRIRTNTPLQALVTLNDTVFLAAAGGLGLKMQKAGEEIDQQLIHGYQEAVLRSPSPEKLKVLKNLYQEANKFYTENPAELQKFLGSTENMPKKDSQSLAALVVVANAILNLDEFVMKE